MPLPNIVVTGTPGTGKTTFSQLLLATLPEGFQHVNIGDVVKREKAYSGWNDEWDCWDVDEDKVRVCTLIGSRVRALSSYTSLLGHVPLQSAARTLCIDTLFVPSPPNSC
jgi:adenylate kinase